MPLEEFEILLKYSILKRQIYEKSLFLPTLLRFFIQYSINSHKIGRE